jgi:hypothetical protein
MHRARLPVALVALALIGAPGCMSASRGYRAPGLDTAKLHHVYVAHLPPDQRGVNDLITNALVRRGVHATTGPGQAVPADADALLEYEDKWQWDITMYMVELRVYLHDPKTGEMRAMGKVLHSSLERRSPEQMVAEVLDDIFGTAAKGKD